MRRPARLHCDKMKLYCPPKRHIAVHSVKAMRGAISARDAGAGTMAFWDTPVLRRALGAGTHRVPRACYDAITVRCKFNAAYPVFGWLLHRSLRCSSAADFRGHP